MAKAVVIGAGIVGLSCALYLQRDGHQVTLIDPREPGTATSFGNAGGIVATASAPVVMPDTWKQLHKLLLDPLGPMVVRWRYLPKIAPWFLRALIAGRSKRVEEISDALCALNTGVIAAWHDLARLAGAEEMLRPVGWFKVYETDKGFGRSAPERALMAKRDQKFEVLNADEIRQLEPGLAPIFKHGFFQPDCDLVVNPGRMTGQLAAAFSAGGGAVLQAEATGFDLAERPYRVRTTHEALDAEIIVLAAGAWSRGLAKQLGAPLPLDTERGYHLMLPPAEPGLRRPTVHGELSFCLSPQEGGIRIASQDEFAGVDAPPDYRRIRSLIPQAKRMLPSLEAEEQSVWLGRRPSFPDSLPVIGPSARHPGVFFAFGHGHLGMTQGPVTGRIIADLAAQRDPGLDPAPFSAERF
ncbi:MAG: FAD-binding oxidoreductase [Pseudomonadota bacterium]